MVTRARALSGVRLWFCPLIAAAIIFALKIFIVEKEIFGILVIARITGVIVSRRTAVFFRLPEVHHFHARNTRIATKK